MKQNVKLGATFALSLAQVCSQGEFTVMILSLRTNRSGQTVQTQIRLLLEGLASLVCSQGEFTDIV